MATKLTGLLNLSRIPKSLITKNKNNESTLWVDIVPNRNGADQYGNTHSIQVYDKENKQVIYLGNVKPQEFGGKGSAEASNQGGFVGKGNNDDLPF